MAEIKLQRTAYKFRSSSALYIKLSPLLLVGLLASLIRPEFFIKLKFSWLQSVTLTEVEPGKHELSSLRDIHLRYFLKNFRPSSTELLLLFLLLFTLLYTVLLLSCVWLTSFKLRFFYHRCYFKEGTAKFGEFVTNYATHIFVNELLSESNSLENVSRRSSILLPLYRTGFIYYLHDYKKFVYNSSNNRFEPVEHIDDIDVANVRNWQGLLSVSEGVPNKSGLESNLNVCADLYGPNDYEIPRCNFWEMLMEAFLAPFFVFQVTSTLLWIFDDYLYYSLISIFSMVLIEVQMVYKRILEYNRINSMSLPPYYIHVYRDYKWQQILTNQLYPGDIVLLSTNSVSSPVAANAMNRSAATASGSPNKANLGNQKANKLKPASSSENRMENMLICPCDCLILEGEVIVDESILTGESIPQFKTSAEEHSKNQRNSTIFSGTHIMVTRNPNVSTSTLKCVVASRSMDKLSSEGCVCLVIRTGFESYQGRLVHSILNSDPNKVANNNKQGYLFLLLLLMFAVGSVTIVVKKSNYKSIKKLLLVSSRILVSVIPPEFPITLSMAVTIGLIQLRRKGIYCTDPNRLPLAATIDVVAFDKTGTLTQDQMYLNGLYYTNSFNNYLYNQASVSKSSTPRQDGMSIPSQENYTEKPEMELLYWYSRLVVAGCHSLTYVNEFVTGDPMEKIPFKYFENQIDTKNNNLVYLNFDKEVDVEGGESHVGSLASDSQKGFASLNKLDEKLTLKPQRNRVCLRILKRWRFTSELGRMSVLAQVATGGSRLEGASSSCIKDETLLLVKGSPEKIKLLLRVVPVYFDSVCHELTLKGLRVLCLAYKKLYDIPPSALVAIDRNIVEKDLEFCGFLALEAPIKNSSRVCMRRLKGHKQIMITGDNILTACHVTQEINLNGWEHKDAPPLYNLSAHTHKRMRWLRNLFKKRSTGSLTMKDYLKNHNYNLVDECPLSSMTMDKFKKCPIYAESQPNCPFLTNQKKEVKMHIQRCPLTQSLVNSYSGSSASSASGVAGGSHSLGGVTPEKWSSLKELYNRNSYKRFIEMCPANLNIDSTRGRCPLSQSNPDLSSLISKSASERTSKSPRRGCPIQYFKRLYRSLYLTTMRIMFPYYYYTYYATPSESRDEYLESDNFGILSYYKGNFVWKRRNGEDFFPDSTNEQIIQNMYRLLPNHKLCITGTALEHLILNTNDPGAPAHTRKAESTNATPTSTPSPATITNWTMNKTLLIISNCTVFARMSPQQKEFIIKCFKLNNKIVAMCGDGTNDIAALKQAHIGISLLNTIKKQPEPKVPTKINPRDKLRQSLNDELPSIKLGEASIASPFTYHGSDVTCVFNLVKSGRCALSNVFMLYKLMGINSLITALGMSILALDGVNFSDAQTTLYSLMYTYLVLALSKSKPSDIPSEKKPARSIFSCSNFLSLVAQILIHSFFLLYTWNLGKVYRSSDYVGYLDAPFEPNIVNTLIYYVWFGINLSSFISNYIDYPYMEPITSNKYLYKPILFSFSLLLMFLSDVVKPLNSFFSLVPISNYVLKLQVVAIVALDLVLTYIASRVINYLLT